MDHCKCCGDEIADDAQPLAGVPVCTDCQRAAYYLFRGLGEFLSRVSIGALAIADEIRANADKNSD